MEKYICIGCGEVSYSSCCLGTHLTQADYDHCTKVCETYQKATKEGLNHACDDCHREPLLIGSQNKHGVQKCEKCNLVLYRLDKK